MIITQRFVNDNNRLTFLLWIAILACLTWMAAGFFPMVNIERDSALYAAGCERMFQTGIQLPPDYHYAWTMQPLVSLLVVGTKYIIPQLSAEVIYYAFTISFSIIFLFLAASFVSKLTSIRCEYIFLLLFLFPESYSIAFYPNTAIFASVIALLGFYALINNRNLVIVVSLLAIAPLMRIDILTIYPVVLILYYHRDRNWKPAIVNTVTVAVLVVLILLVSSWFLKIDPLSFLVSNKSMVQIDTGSFNLSSFFKINAAFYSISSLIFIITGFWLILRMKKFSKLAIITYPVVILYYLYGDFEGAATKHLQYLLPFLAIPAAYTFQYIKESAANKQYVLISGIAAILFFESFIGVAFYPESKPWVNKTYASLNPNPILLPLLEKDLGNHGTLRIQVGAGQVINTADEFILLTGKIFTPFYWQNLKKKEVANRDIFEKILLQPGDTLYLLTNQASDWRVSQYLHRLGYQIKDTENLVTNKSFIGRIFKNGHSTVNTSRIDVPRMSDSFNKAFTVVPHRPLYQIVYWDWQKYMINEGQTSAIPISDNISVIY